MKNTFGQKIFDNLLTLMANKDFRNEIIAIREEFNIPESGVDDKYEQKYGKDNIGYCVEALEKLRVKYKLNEQYGVCLMYAIIFAKRPDKIILDNMLPFRFEINQERGGLKYAAIKIYPETTKADIINNWSEIKKFSKNIYGYDVANQRPIKNAWRDMEVRAMKRWGMKNKEIADMLDKLYPQAVYTYDDIAKIIFKNKKAASKKLKYITKIK